MPDFSSFAAFGKKCEEVAYRIDETVSRRVTRAQAERAQKIAHAEAVQDLGADAAFSRWPGPLDTHLKDGPNGSTILLPTRESAGQWTTANRGRNRGQIGSFLGPGIQRATGATSRNRSGALRKVRTFRARRWTGYTDPKHTADRAVERMAHELTRIADDGLRIALVKHFDVN